MTGVSTNTSGTSGFDIGSYMGADFSQVPVGTLTGGLSTTDSMQTSDETPLPPPNSNGNPTLTPPNYVALTPDQIAQFNSIIAGSQLDPSVLQQILNQIPVPPPATDAGSTTPEEEVDQATTSYGSEFVKAALAQGVPPSQLSALGAAVNNTLNTVLQNAFANPPGSNLSPEEQLQVVLQILVPEAGGSVPGANPNLSAAANAVAKQINDEIKQDPNFPPWLNPQQFPSSIISPRGSCLQELANENDQLFQAALGNASLNGQPLTAKQQDQLEYAHYFPSTAGSLPPELQQIFQQCNSSFQNLYGITSGYTPPTNVDFQAGGYNQAFSQNLTLALLAYTPPLSSDQMSLIASYSANPMSAPENIRNIVAQVTAQAIDATKTIYPGLPANWTPSIYPTSISAANIFQATITQGMLNNLQEKYQLSADTVQTMPSGPTQGSYLEFLSVVGNALNKLQKSIYALQASEGSIMRVLTNLQNVIATSGLKKMRELQIQARRKLHKEHSFMSKFSQDMEYGMCAIFFPVGTIYVADQVYAQQHGTTPITTQIFNKTNAAVVSGVTKAVRTIIPGKLGKTIGEHVGHLVASTVDLAMIIVLCVFGGFAGIMAATNNSGMATQTMETFIPANNKKAIEMGAMVLNMMIQFVAMIAIAVVMIIIQPEGPGEMAAAAEVTGEVAVASAEIADTGAAGAEVGAAGAEAGAAGATTGAAGSGAVEAGATVTRETTMMESVFSKMSTSFENFASDMSSIAKNPFQMVTMKYLMLGFDVTTYSLTMQGSVIQIDNAKLQMKLAEITKDKSILQSSMDNTVEVMGSVVKALQEDLSNLSGQIVSVNTDYSSMIKGLSSLTTTISQALSA